MRHAAHKAQVICCYRPIAYAGSVCTSAPQLERRQPMRYLFVHVAGRPVLVRSVLLCWQQCAAGTDTSTAHPSTAMNTRCAADPEILSLTFRAVGGCFARLRSILGRPAAAASSMPSVKAKHESCLQGLQLCRLHCRRLGLLCHSWLLREQ